ncbi:MAG: exo-beta-N-acetylmuramidase NamZ domain-containing protein, partial [Pseudomonadota bacterium]
CRFYTYISTMKLAMEAAARSGVGFVVLDRPNPIDGVSIEGPMLDAGDESFVGCYALPLRHGMTIGEIARLMTAEGVAPGVGLTVVPCEGWDRYTTWDRGP